MHYLFRKVMFYSRLFLFFSFQERFQGLKNFPSFSTGNLITSQSALYNR